MSKLLWIQMLAMRAVMKWPHGKLTLGAGYSGEA